MGRYRYRAVPECGGQGRPAAVTLVWQGDFRSGCEHVARVLVRGQGAQEGVSHGATRGLQNFVSPHFRIPLKQTIHPSQAGSTRPLSGSLAYSYKDRAFKKKRQTHHPRRVKKKNKTRLMSRLDFYVLYFS